MMPAWGLGMWCMLQMEPQQLTVGWGLQGRYELLRPKRTSLRHRIPDADEGCLEFLSTLLTVDPKLRPTAAEALQHPWLSFKYPPITP